MIEWCRFTKETGVDSIDNREQFDSLVAKYYAAILRYCKVRLPNNHFAAEECTQDVFFLLFQKLPKLDLNNNIKGWLYASADRIIRNYLKRNHDRMTIETESLESISDFPAIQPVDHSEYFQSLSDEEYSLLRQYYGADKEERVLMANALGITMDALYQRIRSIKNKVKSNN
jgi:RNA polymerase sigma factor (sigma-70 family)